MELPLQLTPLQVRGLRQWKVALDSDNTPSQFIVRIAKYFGLMIIAGVFLSWLAHEVGFTEGAWLLAGMFIGGCLREAKRAIQFFQFLPVARQIIRREKIDELLQSFGG